MTIHAFLKIILLCLLVSCSQPDDSRLNSFKHQVVNDFDELESTIGDSFQKQDAKYHLGKAIEKFFEQRSAKGSKGGCTIAVLDPHMRYVAGRYLGIQDTEITIVDSALKNYQYLKESFDGLEKGRMAQNILYYKKDKIFVIAKSVKQGQVVLGYLFFAYHEERIKNDWKISDEQFLSVDFGKTG